MPTPQPLPVIYHWSTAPIAPHERRERVVDMLGKTVVPVNVAMTNARDFGFHMTMADLCEGFSVIRHSGSPHRSFRGKRELARSGARSFHFLINLLSPWTLEHRGQTGVAPGEGVLVDSRYMHQLVLPHSFDMVHIKMSEDWMQRWLPSAELLTGKPLALDSGLGRALNLFAGQLSPHSVVTSPLHFSGMADQFGALLAMAAQERSARPQQAGTGLHDLVRVCIEQRSSNPCLQAGDVAADLQVGVEQVHAALLEGGTTFAAVVAAARRQALQRMLKSPAFRQLTLREVRARAGYADGAAAGAEND